MPYHRIIHKRLRRERKLEQSSRSRPVHRRSFASTEVLCAILLVAIGVAFAMVGLYTGLATMVVGVTGSWLSRTLLSLTRTDSVLTKRGNRK